jgi:GNAT superfamily N-acetyltransferase
VIDLDPITHAQELPAPIFSIRPAVAEDLPFIRGSWLESNKHTRISSQAAVVYGGEEPQRIRAVLARDGIQVRVACVPDTPNAIMGWAVLEPHPKYLIHYVYVRRDARLLGIAKTLVHDAPKHAEFVSMPKFPLRGEVSITLPSTWRYNFYRGFNP